MSSRRTAPAAAAPSVAGTPPPGAGTGTVPATGSRLQSTDRDCSAKGKSSDGSSRSPPASKTIVFGDKKIVFNVRLKCFFSSF